MNELSGVIVYIKGTPERLFFAVFAADAGGDRLLVDFNLHVAINTNRYAVVLYVKNGAIDAASGQNLVALFKRCGAIIRKYIPTSMSPIIRTKLMPPPPAPGAACAIKWVVVSKKLVKIMLFIGKTVCSNGF